MIAEPGDEHHRRDDDGRGSWPLTNQRLTQLENRVERGFASIEQKLDNLGFVRSDVYAVERDALRDRIHAIERKLESPDGEVPQAIAGAGAAGKWALNLMITAFVVAMIGGLIGLALQGGG
ncbi:MAG TPA: hypothetical protein VFK52_10740 [Nocardioidaceae bacterium]|nr:hypothetical protein [Nocardioidaceae bacterium]